MKPMKDYYVQVVGITLNARTVELLGEEVSNLIYEKKLVGTTESIPVYRLNADQVKKLQDAGIYESFKFTAYRNTRHGLVHIADLRTQLKCHKAPPSRRLDPVSKKVRKEVREIRARLRRKFVTG
jgi:hypothetical protein